MSAAPRRRPVFAFTFRPEIIQIYCCCSGFHLQRLETSASTSRSEFGGISLFFLASLRQQPAPESRLKRVQERLLKCRSQSPGQAPFERHTPLQGKICNTHHENWPGGLQQGLTSLSGEEKTSTCPLPSDPPPP